MTSLAEILPLLPPPDPDFRSPEYIRAIEYLETTYPPAVIKLGLERITRLLELLGRPQDAFPSIIVAGTNGKGSTCANLESILLRAGLSVGTNLSPHLEEPCERIRVNGEDIAPVAFARLIHKLAGLIDGKWDETERPTYHELLTTAALVHFAYTGVQIAILEVGLGGRFDAANAVDAPLVILTPISFDHTDRLGNTLASIAGEKAAVVRQGAFVVCAPQHPEAMSTIDAALMDVGSGPKVQLIDEPGVYFAERGFIASLNIDNFNLNDIRLGINGACQGLNAKVAATAAMTLRDIGIPRGIDLDMSARNISSGIASARLPARFEIVSESPFIAIDGAHNESGARCLAKTLEMVPRHWIGVVGMKSDKDPRAFLRETCGHLDVLFTCPIPDIKSYKPEGLAGIASAEGLASGNVRATDDPADALEMALSSFAEGQGIIVTGSLYLAGHIRKLLRGNFDGKPA